MKKSKNILTFKMHEVVFAHRTHSLPVSIAMRGYI